MNKINILFTICFLWIVSIQLDAQSLTFDFGPAALSANVGDEIDVDVIVGDGFDNLAGLQFGINYNGAALEYISNSSSDDNPLNGYSVAKRPNKSEIVNVWFHFAVNPPSISVAPGTKLYSLKFLVLSDIGNSIDILCGEGEVQCEIITEDSQTFDDITVDQQTDINGGGDAQNLGPIGFDISNEQTTTGSQSCVQFAVSDFVDILSMQFSIQYDEAVLSYSNILQTNNNCPGDPPSSVSNPLCLDNGNIDLFAPGTLNFTYNDFSGGTASTLIDGTVILDVCFDVTGAGGTSSDVFIDGNPLQIEVTKNGEGDTNFGLTTNVGSVTVTGEGGPLEVVAYTIGAIGSDMGTNACVPVTVTEGFTDITGFAWSIDYDPSILNYTGIQNINSELSSLGVNESSAGSLSFVWNTFIANSEVTLADGTVLYEMCFDVIGNSGQMSPLTFSDDPTPIETVKVDGPDPDMEQDLTIVNTTDGNITVTNSEGFNLIVCEMDVCPSDQICLPMLAVGATQITSLQFTLDYDPAVMTFTNFVGDNNVLANENEPGKIGVIYFSLSDPPEEINLEDCEEFGVFCFDVIGAQGTSTVVEITDDPVEYTAAVIGDDGFPEPIPVASTPGSVSIDCGGSPGMPITNCVCGVASTDLAINELDTEVSDITCNGDQDGSIILSVTGGETPLTYAWSNGADTKDIENLGLGTYTIDITDNAGEMVSSTFTIEEPLVLQPNSTATNTSTPTANDGSISLNVSGGVGPYTYDWTGGLTTATINNLAPDTYNVTITDANNCTLVTSRTVGSNLSIGPIGGPGSPAGTTIITDVACFGENTGSIELALMGGVAPFNISWNNSSNQEDLFGLAAGNYCVTVVDTNGESIDQCYEVTGPAFSLDIITVSETPQSLPSSNDGAIDINVAGGEGVYTYNWNGPGINNVSTQDISNLTEGSYTVNVTDDRGCARSRTFFVDTAGEPLSINSGTTQVATISCFGANDGAINPAVSGGTAPYTYSWSGLSFTANTANISGLAPGSYQLTVTDAAGMTAESVLFLISQPASPLSASAQITAESSPGQNDGGIDLTVTGGTPGYSFGWSNFNQNEDNFALTMGTYSVTITDARGCTFTDSYEVPFDADPLVIDALGSTVNNVRCFGDSNGSISPVVNGGFPPYNYNWGFSTDKDISGLAAGNYTLTVTDQNGVSDIQTFLIQSPTSLDINVDNSVRESADGNDGAIFITVTGGTPTYSYSWSGPNMFASTAEDITNLSEGLYTITAIDENGCSESRNIALGAILNIENKFEIDVDCFGECTGEIDIVVVGGQPPYLYSWSGPDSFSATTQDISNLCAGTYAATISDALGQEVFTTCRIDEPLLALNIADNPTIINEVVPNNGSINITVNGGTAPYSYSWSNSDTSEDLTDLKAGFYRVTITDANGCITISPEYEVERIPVPLNIESLVINAPTCADDCNGSVTIEIQGGDAPYEFAWNDGENQTLSTANPTYARNNMCAGTYILTISDANGQEIMRTILLEDLDPIVIMAELMHETNGNDGAINTTVTGGEAPYSYDWAPSTLPDTPDQENLSAGLYIVTVTDANSCIVIESFVIDNNVGPLTIENNVSIIQIDCFGDTNGSIDISVSGGVMPYTFIWSDSGAQNTEDAIGLGAGSYTVIITDAVGDQVTGGPYTINMPSEITRTFPTFTNATPGECDGVVEIVVEGGQAPYDYMWSSGEDLSIAQLLCEGVQNVTVIDALGCVKIFEFDLNNQNISMPQGIPTIEDVDCNGNATGSISLEVFNGIAPYTYEWSTSATTPNIGGLIRGFYTVTITDEQGTSTVEGPFEVSEPEELVINFNVTPESGMLTGDGSAQAIVSGGIPPYTYQWNNPDGGGCNTFNCENLTAGTYFVVVQDANECILVDSVVIANTFGGECMETRNIITPDQDGKNDSFLIQCAPNSINTLEIYNRWGQLVFLADNYDNSWEGTNRKGQALPAGGYFYVFILEDAVTGESIPFQGHITILRE